MRNIARTIVALAADPEHEDDRESIKTGNRISLRTWDTKNDNAASTKYF